MLSRKALVAAVGATLAFAGLAFAPVAKADRVAFNLSFAGPGYGVSVGNAPYYRGYAPRYHGHRHYGHWRPAPVYVAPPVVYRAPVPYYAPVPVYTPPYYYPGRVYYGY